MERSYEFRIYPSAAQRAQIERTFGCCRWVYNKCLETRRAEYATTGKSSSVYDLQKMIPGWKKTEAPWLAEADATALQSSVADLGRAYEGFFRRVRQGGAPGFPRFKSKRDPRQSYRSKRVGDNIAVVGARHVKLPKLGPVKARVSRAPQGRIVNATVKRVPSGKYFVALCCVDVTMEPWQVPDGAPEVTGVDAGMRVLATTSEGAEYANPRALTKTQKRLGREQRRLSRRQRGSRNRERQRLKVARLHEKAANQRKDALHKVTTAIVRESQAVAVEDLDVRGMLRRRAESRRADRRIHASVSDASMAELLRQLEYKCAWHGRPFVRVDPRGTSETCSACGHSQAMPPWRRTYRCPECGLVIGRDQNAAINIGHNGRRVMCGTAGHAGTAAFAANACGADVRPAMPSGVEG